MIQEQYLVQNATNETNREFIGTFRNEDDDEEEGGGFTLVSTVVGVTHLHRLFCQV